MSGPCLSPAPNSLSAISFKCGGGKENQHHSRNQCHPSSHTGNQSACLRDADHRDARTPPDRRSSGCRSGQVGSHSAEWWVDSRTASGQRALGCAQRCRVPDSNQIPNLKIFAARMRQAGKPHRCFIVAIAHNFDAGFNLKTRIEPLKKF